uniref:Uncharacterized protein n=1 Tax=Rhodnius prolixus TaxID=13249 RepID=T1HJ94_RHOPR
MVTVFLILSVYETSVSAPSPPLPDFAVTLLPPLQARLSADTLTTKPQRFNIQELRQIHQNHAVRACSTANRNYGSLKVQEEPTKVSIKLFYN